LPFALNPTVIECVVAEFPDEGRYRGWRGSEMIHQALSGTMYMTGRPDRQPLYGLGHRAYYACGTTACISVLAALEERWDSGLGQRVEATVFESLAAIGQNFISQYSYSKTFESRQRYPGFLALLKCSDLWMVLFAVRNWEGLCSVFNLEELLQDDRFATQAGRHQHWELAVQRLQDRARTWRASDLVDALQRERISAEVVAPLEVLVSSPQWEARRLVRRCDTGDGSSEAALGPPFSIGESPYVGVAPTPRLQSGLGSSETWESERWPIPSSAPEDTLSHHRQTRPDHPGPLAGLRVLDMTTAWAGPFAARSLAYLGAEVIKIDAPSHMDSWRGAPDGSRREWYPDGDPGEHPWNRCVLFNTQGQGKLSVGLDLKVEGALDVFGELVRVSDVVITNFAPGVLPRLGIDYPALRALNPRIVVVEMPAFGPGGPDSGHQGMGKTMEAACGMAACMGYGDGVPVLTGPAYLDPIGGLNAVAATLIALNLRRRRGEGCRVVVPQTEAGIHWIGELVLQQAEGGIVRPPNGNALDDAAPHEAYPAQGDDEWVVVAVRTDDEWAALCQVIGRPDLRQSARFADLASRQLHRSELDAIISAWTRGLSKLEAASRLQAAGVPAAPVANGADLWADPVLRSTGFSQELVHPEAGRHLYPTLSYHLARTKGAVIRPAPCFGEHNASLLTTLLGMTSKRVGELARSGVLADRPVAAGRAAESGYVDAKVLNPGEPHSSASREGKERS